MENNCIQSWKKWLPDYTLKCWDEDNFNYKALEFTREAYKLKKYAFVSDVCRLYALYQEGGIYLDTDMLVLKDFSPLLVNSFFLGEEKSEVLNAAILGCQKGHHAVKKLLEGYKSIPFSSESPMNIPSYLTSNLDKSKVKIYPNEYFYPLPFKSRGKDFRPFIRPNSFAVHLWNHSWKDEWSYLHDKNFRKSFEEFFNGIRLRGWKLRDLKFVLSFLKFWLAARFPSLYKSFEKSKRR
ncbi:glycosyltransferase [Aquiflexum lacus]|uniref:glycosyltransferase n=1 Tax=Aquiflexum lacus TaxID=2483805 RepID=UPI001E557D87|nr:glycosyltransferase [Aquiflexum lacus]